VSEADCFSQPWPFGQWGAPRPPMPGSVSDNLFVPPDISCLSVANVVAAEHYRRHPAIAWYATDVNSIWALSLWTSSRTMRTTSIGCQWHNVYCLKFKLCSLVTECLRRAAPSYLTDLCIAVSATTARCFLSFFFTCWPDDPRSQLSHYGSCSFAVCGPAAWNSLPAAVQDLSSSSSCFCSHLKTELFCMASGVNSP